MKHIFNIQTRVITLLLFSLGFISCKKFVEIDPPRTSLVTSTVFENDVTADAAMTSIYYNMESSGFASGGTTSISFWGTYSADEQIDYAGGPFHQFNENDILPDNQFVNSLWSELYKTIYSANAVLEGISQSAKISASLKVQLEGEAKFVRAFCHFYLVNLWGDVPLVLTTDYRTNSTITRTPKSEVYLQIIKDLKESQNLLPGNYAHAKNERVRANKWVASALLARVYLYIEQWANAETEASSIIANSAMYSLKPILKDVFLKNSTEAILQWWKVKYSNDFLTFSVFNSPPTYGLLRSEFVNSFEAGDSRRTTWIGTATYAPPLIEVKKFTYVSETATLDYSTVFRLAEQYLIRAEARAMQNKLVGANSAESDINIIRLRARLPVTSATNQGQLLLAIEQERKAELFTEWGHRWLDLKRTGRATAVLSPLKPLWQPTDMLYPIPSQQIINSGMTQNPGY